MTYIYTWHKKFWDILTNNWDKKPNAFLFLGRKDTGILNFAEYFSKTLLCENITSDFNPCNNCCSCLLFNTNNHSDFYYIGSTKESKNNTKIKIDIIKDLINKINLSSLRGGLKVVLINAAEDLNNNAANSILKLLEEPPKNVIFLLISYDVDKVLPTILSRCRKLILSNPTYQEAYDYLIQCNNKDDIVDTLSFNSGNPIFSMNDEKIILQNKLFEFLSEPKIVNLIEISEILDKNKISLELCIDWLLKWIIDIIILYYTNNIMYNIKFKTNIMKIVESINILKIFQMYDKLKDIYRLSSYNLNFRLQLESLLIEYINL